MQYLAGTTVVLLATYLYNAGVDGEQPKAPEIRMPASEKGKEQGSYFALAPAATPSKPALRGEALSTSRPTTPTVERLPHKLKSPDSRQAKREQ